MTALTLELTDGQARKWAQEAERLKITPEQPIMQSVEDHLEGRRRSVSQAIKRIIREDDALSRPLVTQDVTL